MKNQILRLSVILFLLMTSFTVFSQGKKDWLVAYPITSYIVEEDNVIIVQAQIPDNLPALKIEKDAYTILKKSYGNDENAENIEGGAMKCMLIKGEYHYLACKSADISFKPVAGDLLFYFIKKPSTAKLSLVPIASKSISFSDVNDNEICNAGTVMSKWSKAQNAQAIDDMIKDIKSVGNYYLENGEIENYAINEGRYKGRKLFDVMASCTATDVDAFLKYAAARFNKYAGQNWRISEVFATWVNAGAPSVEK
ncbi:MAG TPA: hypothetical protein PLP27_11965 [Crocinitomicaceae bacterium]|nr:hypothetical protein [Crocinitomicaceae bacterium]